MLLIPPAHCGRLLEGDADAAARRVFDGLFGLVVQVVVLQTVAGRSQGAEMGAGARATHPSDRRTWPRSMRRTMEGGIAWVWKWGGERACAFASVGKLRGQSKECVPERERVRLLTRRVGGGMQGKGGKLFAFASAGADRKTNT